MLTNADVSPSAPGRAVQQLFRWYRAPATGLCFLVFGFCAAVLSLLLKMNPEGTRSDQADRRKHRFAALAFRAFIGFMHGVGIMRHVRYRGLDNLPSGDPCVILANHPTLIDPVVLLAEIGAADCIMKEKHLRFFGVIARWLNYIPDQESLALYERCVERIEEGRRLLLFPERTRSPKNGLRKFSRVPAQVSLATGCKIVPVLIECNHQTLRRDQSWYDVPPDPIEMTVTFFQPVHPASDGSFAERTRTLTARLKSFYRDRLELDDADGNAETEAEQTS